MYQVVSDKERERLKRAWRQKHRSTDDYQVARDGDHLMTPFECDKCVFWKLKGRHPIEGNPQDNLLKAVIRQSNLDAFWSRARSTVTSNKNLVKQQIEISKTLGLEGPFVDYGPSPSYDHCAREVALSILIKSRQTTGKKLKNTPTVQHYTKVTLKF